MTKKFSAKSVALAAGASFAISLAASPVAMADSNPFSMNKLSTEAPTQLASGKCGEGKCGGKPMSKEGKCGEGKCGGKEMGKGNEGKCGEGKCGGKAKSEGKCGSNNGKGKGKCGEGKCGGN